MRKLLVIFACLILVLVVVAPVSAQTPGRPSIGYLLANDNAFETFTSALNAAGLLRPLANPDPNAGVYTVFAPTDAAFNALPREFLDSLNADPDALVRLLRYHLAQGALDSATLAGLPQLRSGAGILFFDSAPDGTITINGAAKIILKDVTASNGVIHVIDAVLQLPQGGFNNLVLVVPATPILTGPAGDPTGWSIGPCQTTFISAQVGNFFRLGDQGGWISAFAVEDVPETYGQPGYPKSPSCP